MQFVPKRLKILTEDGKQDTFDFVGRTIGRSFGEKVDRNHYRKVIKIYQTESGDFILHFYRRNDDGRIIQSDYARSNSLEMGEARAALKEAGIYSGPETYSKALYNTIGILEKIE